MKATISKKLVRNKPYLGVIQDDNSDFKKALKLLKPKKMTPVEKGFYYLSVGNYRLATKWILKAFRTQEGCIIDKSKVDKLKKKK